GVLAPYLQHMDFDRAILWLGRAIDAMSGWPSITEGPMASNRRQLLGTCCAALSTFLAPKLTSPSHADPGKYPTKPVRVIVPFAAGGPNDLLARIIAQGLSTSLRTQFYVENLGGAGG